MHCASPKSQPCFFTLIPKHPNPKPKRIQFTPRNQTHRKPPFTSLKCVHNPDISNTQNPSWFSSFSSLAGAPQETFNVTADKLRCLASEFRSLSESIDRVKRLLHYADLLPPFEDSGRVEANRVKGCTTQVWLEARLDSKGLMRFRADSDSEITKGFCSCLVWVLDGAAPEEVLAVDPEDLADMNVGFSGRAHSRVNTWHNVLMNMQKRTKALVEEEREAEPSPNLFPSLVVAMDDLSGNGTFAEAQERLCTPEVVQLS